MTGPNNYYGYKTRMPNLLGFIGRNPGMREVEILNSIGRSYQHSFRLARILGLIVRGKDSEKRCTHWVLREKGGTCGKKKDNGGNKV